MKTARQSPPAVPPTSRNTRKVHQVQPPTVVVTVPSAGLEIDLGWASRTGDVVVTSDTPFAIVPVSENAVMLVRQR